MSVARPTPWKRRPLYETTISTAQRVAAMALGGQLVFHQLDRVVGDAIDCLINRIDRAIAGGGLGFSSPPQISFTEAVAMMLLPDCTLK